MKIDHCHHGDALDVLPTLPAGSVQTCITSPPYWGLRDYGTATWEGGDEDCGHRVGGQVQDTKAPGAIETGQRPGVDASRCPDCGARRIDAQLGLEATPEEYVAKMVAVFRAVRRVLRDDGTLWMNLGDAYANNSPIRPRPELDKPWDPAFSKGRRKTRDTGLKMKDLIGIPWRVAFALQADGWYLRSDIIWSKPNPMPESVTDRPTKAHEYVFLLSKAARYYYDADAIAEKGVEPDRQRLDRIGGANGHTVRHSEGGMMGASSTRNRRSVWTVPSAPYPDAHFATFPPSLIEPCVLAGAPAGGVVLDPFMGSGTTAQVAQRLGRRWIGIELSAEYIELQARRTAQWSLPLEAAE